MITKGTYTITSNPDGKIVGNGPITQVEDCCLTHDSSAGKPIRLIDDPLHPTALISTSCSTLATNRIDITDLYDEIYIGHFQGPVDCSHQGGNTATTTTNQQQSSSSATGTATIITTQDRDRDGIPDANDNCPNLPNTRCYKEGDTALVVHNRNR
ncbi:MAG: thrombospondin type 3 repeat-containing protein [Nitrososphaera sp.]